MINTTNRIYTFYSYYLSTYVRFFMLSFTMNLARFTLDTSFNVDIVAVVLRHRKGASVSVLTSLSLQYVNLKPSYSTYSTKNMIL